MGGRGAEAGPPGCTVKSWRSLTPGRRAEVLAWISTACPAPGSPRRPPELASAIEALAEPRQAKAVYLNQLYGLLSRAEGAHQREDAAALRWAMSVLDPGVRPTRR